MQILIETDFRKIMPKCVLRVIGATRKIRSFLRESSFEPINVYYKGEVGIPRSRGLNKISGFNLALSSSCGDSIEKQQRQALEFFKKNKEEIDRLRSFGFKMVIVDFGLFDLSSNENPWPTYQLSKYFLEAIGKLGFQIVLSFYGHEEN